MCVCVVFLCGSVCLFVIWVCLAFPPPTSPHISLVVAVDGQHSISTHVCHECPQRRPHLFVLRDVALVTPFGASRLQGDSGAMVKRCHWRVTEGTESTTCPLLIRIPKVQRSGDLSADTEADTRRAAFSFVVNTLWENPGLAGPTQAWLVAKVSDKGPHSDPGRFEHVTTIGKLDSDWLGGWLQRRMKWPSDVFQKALDYDEDALRQMIQFLLIANPQTKLPKACLEKTVTERLFSQRLAECGNRHNLLSDHRAFVAANGRLKWELGLFSFKWAESGEATHAVHLPTKADVTMSQHARLTKDFEMRANWGDRCAMAVHGATRLMLHELWEEGVGPNSVVQWGLKSSKILESTASRLAGDLEQERRNASSEVTDVAFKGTRTAAKHTHAAERARLALSKRKAQTGSKRRVKLSEL